MNLNIEIGFLKRSCFRWSSVEHRLFHFHALAVLSSLLFMMVVPMSDAVVTFPFEGSKVNILYIPAAKPTYCVFRLQSHHHTVYAGCTTYIILYILVAKPTYYIIRLHNQHHTVHSCFTTIIIYSGESLLSAVILRRRCSPGFELGIVCDL